MMGFYDVLARVVEILQREGCTSYRALKRQFALDDDYLEDLKLELIEVKQVAADQDGKMLVWTGDPPGCEPDTQPETDKERLCQAALPGVMWLLQRDERVTYRALKYCLMINDAVLEDVCQELFLRRLAVDEDGNVLVWTGESPNRSVHVATPPNQTSLSNIPAVSQQNGSTEFADVRPTDVSPDESIAVSEPLRSTPEAERRQLTVMFCDLVGSTDLSGKLDPENLREVIQAYQETASEIIERYEGHIAQYLGDGLLVYFGWPLAHEDDAARAVYAALGIAEAMAGLNGRLEADYGVELHTRIGIHTGPVVVGEMGGGGRHENLALGETPNIASRLEGLAQPNTAVMSPVTAQLVRCLFVLEELGPHDLKGVADPVMLFRVIGLRTSDQAEDVAITGGFDTLVGRDEEIGLLLRRWEQSKEGLGQVVLLSGEAGIGKSSLVDGLRDRVRQETLKVITFRCSPYHTNSAFYPIIDRVQLALAWQPDDSVESRLTKLEQALGRTDLTLESAVPLLAGLLSLPLPDKRYPTLTLSPQEQRQQTQDVLVVWLLEEAEHHAVLVVWEDLHWVDPSTLETLGLLVEQAPTAMMRV